MEAAEALKEIAERDSQQDPTFKSSIAYTRLTAVGALTALKEKGALQNRARVFIKTLTVE